MSILTTEEYKLLDKMNKRLRTWHKNNMSNEVINQVQNDLINFYAKYDIDNPSREIIIFKKSNKFTDEQKQEILNIAAAMNSAKSSKLSYYKKMPSDDERLQKAFQTVRNNPLYNVNTFADYVKFVDNLNNAKAIVAELMELDSSMVARVYGYGTDKNLTTAQVNQIMVDAVKNYNDGDSMEQFLQNEIERKELENHINVDIKNKLYTYATKHNVPDDTVDTIIESAINDLIPLDNIDDYLFNAIDEEVLNNDVPLQEY